MKKPAILASLVILALLAFLAGHYSAGFYRDSRPGAKHVLYYYDPMHPSYHSDKPGIAPDCGMALVPRYFDEESSAHVPLPPGAVAISDEKQQLIGVRVETVGNTSGTRTIRTTGRVEADETRVHRLMAGTEGWVESVENNPAGTFVKQNQLLATLYSKEFRNAEQAYISSVISLERLKGIRD